MASPLASPRRRPLSLRRTNSDEHLIPIMSPKGNTPKGNTARNAFTALSSPKAAVAGSAFDENGLASPTAKPPARKRSSAKKGKGKGKGKAKKKAAKTTTAPVPAAVQPHAQPLQPEGARARRLAEPRAMVASQLLEREEYEDDAEQLRDVCAAGGYALEPLIPRYRQEAFDATALLFVARAAVAVPPAQAAVKQEVVPMQT